MTSAAGDMTYLATMKTVAETADLLRDLQDILTGVIGEVIAKLPVIGPALRAEFDRFTVEAGRVLEQLDMLTGIGGNPAHVAAVGERWTAEVSAAITSWSGAVHRGQLPSNGQWKGNAADIYFTGVVPNQGEALTALTSLIVSIHNSLVEIANATDSYWAEVGTSTGALLVTLAGASAVSGRIWGLHGVLVSVVVALIAFNALMDKHRTDLRTKLRETNKNLTQAETNNRHFPAGQWPPLQNTETLQDASVLDEDKVSDWVPTMP